MYIKAVHGDYGYPTNLYGRTDDVYSTFSGHLLQPLNVDILVGKK